MRITRKAGGRRRLSEDADWFDWSAAMPLLTRDPRRYREYFPTLTLIAP